jgi:uncharacterized membrane protein
LPKFEDPMSWLQRYRLRHYVKNSIWILPLFGIVAAVLLARLLHWLELTMGWVSAIDPDTMRSVLGTLAGSMFTFIVFVCSSLLLVVQMASAQLTPRIIGVLFRDTVTKVALSLFVFTFAFAISALVRIGSSVPLLTAEVAAYSSAACLALFLYLIDHVGKLLRPSGALAVVATEAHQVIQHVYPRLLTGPHAEPGGSVMPAGSEAVRTVQSPSDGVVLAFDIVGLVRLGTRHRCVIELVPRVGDFVARGDPIFRIFGGAGIFDQSLYHSIALGAERTMEQDPAYAFRLIVDIASKGLSPAINDPTTAVLAVDRIHHLLRDVGNRRLDNENVRDAAGQIRVIYRTPDWEDFVALAVTEIRQFGGASIQIARRMRAMLEDLIVTLPEERVAPLRHELRLLKKSAERFFVEPEERALADISDSQGMGGRQDSMLSGPRAPHGPNDVAASRAVGPST